MKKEVFLLTILLIIYGCSQPIDSINEKSIKNEIKTDKSLIEETHPDPIIIDEEITDSPDYETNEQAPMEEDNFRIEIPTEKERKLLPDCDNLKFSTFPVDMNDVESITSIGNLGPPGHTFPTDHPHIHLGDFETNFGYPIYAPADVYITSVAWQEGITQDPVDYVIYFALCKDIIGYFNHVKSTSDELNQIIDKFECESFRTSNDGSCTKILLDKVDEGTLLGEVGLKQGNFDFGMIDLRKKLDFIKPERYPERTQHINCAFDYYDESMKKTFYDLIERSDGTCGHIMQDVPNTLKGNWFHESSPAEIVVEWDVFLAFVDHYTDPSIQVVSIAGIFTDPLLFEFIPRHSGLINREFSQVKSDGNIYCYQAESVINEWQIKPTGKIIVKLINDETLNIEHQSGDCTESSSFNKPEEYNR